VPLTFGPWAIALGQGRPWQFLCSFADHLDGKRHTLVIIDEWENGENYR